MLASQLIKNLNIYADTKQFQILKYWYFVYTLIIILIDTEEYYYNYDYFQLNISEYRL